STSWQWPGAAWCWCWMTITACEKGRSTPRSPICSAISPRTCNWRSRPGGDPPLPLGRLRAAGEVLEIRAAQLRFSDAGARALLNDSLALGLEPAEVALLRERTEGWPAGLLAGQGHFTLNGEKHVAGAGQTIIVPAGVPHSVGNPGPAEIDAIVE